MLGSGCRVTGHMAVPDDEVDTATKLTFEERWIEYILRSAT